MLQNIHKFFCFSKSKHFWSREFPCFFEGKTDGWDRVIEKFSLLNLGGCDSRSPELPIKDQFSLLKQDRYFTIFFGLALEWRNSWLTEGFRFKKLFGLSFVLVFSVILIKMKINYPLIEWIFKIFSKESFQRKRRNTTLQLMVMIGILGASFWHRHYGK